jgi:hypothetical protein
MGDDIEYLTRNFDICNLDRELCSADSRYLATLVFDASGL